MAGSYPDVPSHRIPYDRDGSLGFVLDSAASTVLYVHNPNSAELIGMNTEGSGSGLGFSRTYSWHVGVIFPRLLDVGGIYKSQVRDSTFQWSPNTTNGVDGTWNTISVTNYSQTEVNARNGIIPFSLTNVKAVRSRHGTGSGITNRQLDLHVYGVPSAGEDNNLLAIWHPTLDQRLGAADFDWGDDPQGHTETALFRVKNISPSLTANTIAVSRETLSSPEFLTAHQLSTDNTTYVDTISIGNLAPGAISSVLYIRKSYAVNQQLSLAWARIIADATGGWA